MPYQPVAKPLKSPASEAFEAVGLNRRSFVGLGLKGLFLGFAALALEACGQAAWAQERAKPTGLGIRKQSGQGRVVVVGAGIAGLVAADALQRAGHSVQVYEAAHRVGGRIRTEANGAGSGRHVELGAEFFDQSNTLLLGLARRLGLGLLDMESGEEAELDGFVLHLEGQRRSWEALQQSLRGPLATWLRDAKQLPAHLGPDASAAAKALDALDMRRYLDATGASGWGRSYLEKLFTSEYGLEPEALSAAEFLRYVPYALGVKEEAGAERYKLAGGNQALPEALAAGLKAPVILNHPLVSIQAEGSAYRLNFKGPDGPVSVQADQVVLALPMTLLRRLKLDLPVPALQREAWEHSSYGTNAKLVLGCADRPWRARGEAGGFASDGEVAQVGWDATRGRSDGPGALTVFLGGRLGEAAGQRSWEALVQAAGRDLKAVFGALKDRELRLLNRVAWANEPWALGSYASWGPGEASRFGAIAGQAVAGVHFAGEHLGGEFRGHMEGAARSGLAAAKAVMEALRR